MNHVHATLGRSARRGLTIIEASIAMVIMSVLMIAVMTGVNRDNRGLGHLARKTAAEAEVEAMVEDLEDRLEFAQGSTPIAWLVEDMPAAANGPVRVDTIRGFPPLGSLIAEAGTIAEERIDYASLRAAPAAFADMIRGASCSAPNNHFEGRQLRWAGTAEAIEDQVNPPAALWDGRSIEPFGPVFFRGDGTGFSYRVPVDPTGGTNYFDFNGVRWGAEVDGVPTADGWSAILFEVVTQTDEDTLALDANGDGDRADTFDVGRLRGLSWNSAAPDAARTDVPLCPPILLQERCAHGADLDGDGFEDPMFLWDPRTSRLRVRLFLLITDRTQRTEVRRVERTMYVRNGAS